MSTAFVSNAVTERVFTVV